MSEDNHQSAVQCTSHMMKATKRGRPFLKDTLDLFGSLIVSLSLELKTNRQFFKSFHNSFTADAAIANLASLRFSQSNRGPDPRDPSRIVTTVTTNTFSMTRDMAKALFRHFMDGRLIQNAADKNCNIFKGRGVFVLTPKGLHVLERFISKNGIEAEPLAKVFASQPICLKLLHLERRSSDDEIVISQAVVTALFRRFAGRCPNYLRDESVPLDPSQEYHERSKGVPLNDIYDRQPRILGRSAVSVYKYCFQATAALEWLCNFTSLVNRDEAAEMAAHFVRFGLIAPVMDTCKSNHSTVVFTVRGSVPASSSRVSQQGEFYCMSRANYRITDEGRRAARWDEAYGHYDLPPASLANTSNTVGEFITQRRDALPERYVQKQDGEESYTDNLNFILNEPAMRSLFRDFLRVSFCEEKLSFWLEVEDLKRKFNTTSSASGGAHRMVEKLTPGQAAMKKHHESLIRMAFVLYNVYLAPSGQCKLDITDDLQDELSNYLNQIMVDATGKSLQGRFECERFAAMNATQLQTMIHLYDRVQAHCFNSLASDDVPKFIKTREFKALKGWLEA